MCAGTCWAVNSSHEMFPFLHCHSKASSMSQPWMILLPQKKQICLICCTQLVSTSAETLLLWLDCPSGEDMKMLPSRTRRGENDKLLLSQKWAEKVESLAGFGPPWMDDRKRPARKLSGDEGSAVSGEGLTPCRETRLTSWQGGERRGMDGRLQARQGGGRSTTATCEVCDWHLACAAPPPPSLYSPCSQLDLHTACVAIQRPAEASLSFFFSPVSLHSGLCLVFHEQNPLLRSFCSYII